MLRPAAATAGLVRGADGARQSKRHRHPHHHAITGDDRHTDGRRLAAHHRQVFLEEIGKQRDAEQVPQHGLLGGHGEQTVPGHANTLATTTDILLEMKRRFLGLKTGDASRDLLDLGA